MSGQITRRQQQQELLGEHAMTVMKRIPAVLAAAGLAVGLAVLLPGPAWAAGGPQPASGTILITSTTVNSVSTAGGNTFVVFTASGILTGTFDGPFTETDREVIHADGSIMVHTDGIQSGTLGTCGTGTVSYIIESTGTPSALTGRFQLTDQGASTSTPLKIHSVGTLAGSTMTGQFTYTGTYHCT